MALEKMAAGGSWGIALLVSAGIVAEIIAKACSSPQTAHLNAEKRAPTLMYWVNIGATEAIVFVALAAYFDKKHRTPILIGAALELAITYGEYLHAMQRGLAEGGETTESY